jgi:hypothetical protein
LWKTATFRFALEKAGKKSTMTKSDTITPAKGVWKSSLVADAGAIIEQQSGGFSAVLTLKGRPIGYFDAPTLKDLLRLIEKHRGAGQYEGPSFDEASAPEPTSCAAGENASGSAREGQTLERCAAPQPTLA